MTIFIATRNAHKVDEIRQILGTDIRFLTLRDLPNAPEVVEDADTFDGNAVKKATTLAKWLADQPDLTKDELYVLADDSGLEVDALGGAPGVHSARFAADDAAKGNSADGANNAKLLRLLQKVPVEKRTARFRCVLAFAPVANVQSVRTFAGACEGRIELAPRGTSGFGYDPLFIPAGYSQTFGELGEAEKNKLSHRANALAKLRSSFAK
ncbi:MAG: RdgB/HAM1 family non-canonical purine NTP pyrophosphatase [Limisphaerales bacterium]